MYQCILADTISGKKRVKLKQQMDFVDLLSQSLKKAKLPPKNPLARHSCTYLKGCAPKSPRIEKQKLLHLDTKEEYHTPIKGRFRVWPSRHFVTVV